MMSTSTEGGAYLNNLNAHVYQLPPNQLYRISFWMITQNLLGAFVASSQKSTLFY